MSGGFAAFGPFHLLVIAAIPAAAFGLSRMAGGGAALARRIRLGLGWTLAANEIAWRAYMHWEQGRRWVEMLPFQLCDAGVWLTVVSLLTLRRWTYDVAYYAALAGGAMAVLTPDLGGPVCSCPVASFFLAHGGTIAAVLFLAWSGLLRPRPGSVWRAFWVLNLFAAAAGAVNVAFQTNFMYLCRKPAQPSLLDYLGSWPAYLLASEAIAIVLFSLLWLPFQRSAAPRAVQ